MKIALVLALTSVLGCSYASAQSPPAAGSPTRSTDSDAFLGRQIGQFHQKKDTAAAEEPITRGRWAEISWDQDWDPHSLHWDHPSSARIDLDGSVYVFAHHLANMDRTGGFWDTGDYRTFLVNITLFDGDLANGVCHGAVLVSQDFVLQGLQYKQQSMDVSGSGTLPQALLPRTRCISWTRWIR